MPAHLYRKSEIIYLRVSFSQKLRQVAKRSEFRLSLQTRTMRVARQLVAQLYSQFLSLSNQLENNMIDYFELKKRMNALLRYMLKDYDVAESSGFKGDDDREYFYRDDPQSMVSYMQNGIRLKEHEKYSKEIAYGLMRRGFFRQDEIGDDSYSLISKEMAKCHLLYYTILQKRLDGDFEFENIYTMNANELNPFRRVAKNINDNISQVLCGNQAGTSSACAVENAKNNYQVKFPHNNIEVSGFDYRISACIKYYLKLKISDKDIKTHTQPTHYSRLVNLLDYFTDIDIRSLGREELRKFRDALVLMPKNRTRIEQYKTLTMQQIENLKPSDTLSLSTTNYILESISSMFRELIVEKKLLSNPAVGLSQSDNKQGMDDKDPFTQNDLVAIFSTDRFMHQTYKNSAYFWVPLISLFTGMRLEEVSQLYIDDVTFCEDSKLYLIDINENPSPSGVLDKHLKNNSAFRIIPLHKTLVELGFPKYVNAMAQKGYERVFPLLTKSSDQKYGKQPGKQLTQLLRKCKVTGPKSFNSLRHTFNNFFKQNCKFSETENYILKYAFGHEITELIFSRYGSNFTPQNVYETIISRLDHKLDLSHLYNSQYVTFEGIPRKSRKT